jgi:hypothetical protein
VYSSVLTTVCPDFHPTGSVNEYVLDRLFKAASVKHNVAGWMPTVIAEVDRGAVDDVVLGVAKAMKRIGSDSESCRTVVVLSDALAAFALPKDDSRIELVWVEDFTVTEAHALLTDADFLPLGMSGKMLPNGTDANRVKREWVFDMIGTRPAQLKLMLTKVKQDGVVELNAFVESVLHHARDVLNRLLNHDASKVNPSAFDMRQLVGVLLDSPNHSQLAEDFVGVLSKPNKVAPLLKEYHAVLYHHPTMSYRFYSQSYLQAAMTLRAEKSPLLPVIPSNNEPDPFAQYDDAIKMEEVVEAIAKERDYSEEEVTADVKTLLTARVKTVGDLRVLSVERIEKLGLPPVVTEYMLRVKKGGK